MKHQHQSSKKVLLIKTPKQISNSFEKFDSFFKDLHKFIKDKGNLNKLEKTISFELVLKENYFHYRIVASQKLLAMIKSLLYTRFKDLETIEEALQDKQNNSHKLITEFNLKRYNFFPLKTKFSPTDDPYVVLSAVLSKLEHFGEGTVFQLLLYPMSDPWLKEFLREKFFFILGTINTIKIFFEKPFLEHEFINYYKEVQKKFSYPYYLANLRIMAYAKSKKELQENFDLALKSIEKLDNGDVNSLQKVKTNQKTLLSLFLQRQFSRVKMILNTQETAAIFRFPDSELEISSIDKVSSRKIEPPKNLPTSGLLQKAFISSFGITNFRDNKLQFGVRRKDRNRHIYIIGKTGVGKSKLIELLAISDIYQKKGLAIIDPHGDLATNILRFIPKERIPDIIYFNPADISYPIGFNPLDCPSPESKDQVVTGFVAIFKKLFAASWTNRLEHMLRFTVLALVEAENATVIDIVRLLTDINFRQNIIAKLTNPVVKNFWTHEFASWNEKFDNEAIVPIINQVGQFISNDYIRNVVSQKKSAIDFYKAMNEGKIIIINIAKGKLGEDNSSLLGSMIITKIQEAVMARVNLPESERREFYLYVDEFQNFATDAFNEILSEARKFNLSVTIAHQYLGQLSENIRKSVFGNIGSFICFRVGPEDAHYLKKEFSPQVTPEDLISLNVRELYAKLSIAGKTSEPFSASTITIPIVKKNFSDQVIESTRRNYATPRDKIEAQFSNEQEIGSLITEEKNKLDSENNYFEEPII